MSTILVYAQSSSRDYEQENSDFFGGGIWLFVLIPIVVLILLAWSQKKSKQTVPEVLPEDFDAEVLGADVPYLVHFYRSWSIGDQVMIAQVERIALAAQDRYRVGFMNVDDSPDVLGRWADVESPALLLFAGGKRIFHCEGVFDEADVIEEVEEAIRRWERRSDAAPSPSEAEA